MKPKNKKESRSGMLWHLIPVLAAVLLFVCGCGGNTPALFQAGPEENGEETPEVETESPEERAERLTIGNVEIPEEELPSYAEDTVCSFADDGTLKMTLTLPDIPRSEDAMIYVFAFEPCEDLSDPETFHCRPAAKAEKATECTIEWEYDAEQLFCQFVPAVRLNGRYTALSGGVYISNPEAAAANPDGYPETRSKKGLLLDPEMLGTTYLTDLGLQHAIYNIPLSKILGETTDEQYPTISYEYKGHVYKFNGHGIEAYDNLFTYLTNAGLVTTAVILNDWNEEYPELIHPLARNKNKKAYYYAFNTSDEAGCRILEAIATFLMERYSGEHGLVSSWVVANEINQNRTWNYMDTEDVAFYGAEYEKALRIFYTAAKKNFAGAKVYVSIDHDWNDNEGDNSAFFNGRDVLEAINEAARKKGNYDWGLAIHPYPNPLSKVNYWTVTYEKTMDAPLLTLMNLSTVTDFLKQEEYLDRSGNVRSITVTELGFTSASGEKLQAAAFAYCYYIIDANPYIEAFIMNRQTDAIEEVRQGLAFGIYELDHSAKFIFDIFKDIDTEAGKDNIDFMLNIIGADSLEEALSWAQGEQEQTP